MTAIPPRQRDGGLRGVVPPRQRGTPEAIAAAVAAAGASLAEGCATPQDVAAKLKAAHCEGRRGSPQECPLARWFRGALRQRRMLAPRQAVCVDGTTWGRKYLYVHVRGRSGRGAQVCPPVPVPPLVVQFASGFDGGGFPELGG